MGLMQLVAAAFGGVNAIAAGPSLVERINRYRVSGYESDGPHTLRGRQVDDLDYALMGADNSCAAILARSKGVTSPEQVLESRWYAIAPDSELATRHFYNSNGTSRDGGKTFYNENALMSVPRPEFQVTAAEVAWHHSRVAELKAAGVEQPDRVRKMDAERLSTPWIGSPTR